ncbi:MAG: protein TonB [Crocinitomix sp.]
MFKILKMELKKSKEANLENKKNGFRLVGLVMICAIVGMAFEYTGFTALEGDGLAEDSGMDEEILYEIQEEEEPPPPEEEPPPPPPIIEEIEVVDDEEEVDDNDLSVMEEVREELPEEDPPAPVAEKVFDFVEIDPTFPGGPAAMAEWIKKEVSYPELAREMGEQGIVYVKFVVNSKGNIEKVGIRKGISDALDAEAKRVVRRMPKWVPGEQAGKPVSVNFTLPIHFRLG